MARGFGSAFPSNCVYPREVRPGFPLCSEGVISMPKSDMKVLQLFPAVALALFVHATARADVVTDWNIVATETVFAANLPPPPANRTMAIVQTAVYEAVNAITKRYPADRMALNATSEASIDAAVTAANRAALIALVPS